jgi:hypothetical protein
VRLRCSNCEAAFEGDRKARCPKCLRLTTVVEDGDVAPARRDGAPAPWPAGTACPLCLVQPVSDATFHFELAEAASPSNAASSGSPTIVRCRCCGACRRRVVTLVRLRWGALPLVAAGMLAWPLSFASDLPFRLWGIERLEFAMVATLVCAFVVGVPLSVVDHANRWMRRNLETSWLFRRVKEGAARGEPHHGAASRDTWRLLAEAPARATVVEASDLLRHI